VAACSYGFPGGAERVRAFLFGITSYGEYSWGMWQPSKLSPVRLVLHIPTGMGHRTASWAYESCLPVSLLL